MLVDPQIVAYPGENGSPPGACMFTNESRPADGPYACCPGGRYIAKSSIKLVASRLGLLLSDEAQDAYEKLLVELVRLKIPHEAALAQVAELEAERRAQHTLIGELQEQIVRLESALETRDSLAAVAADFLKSVSPKTRRGAA